MIMPAWLALASALLCIGAAAYFIYIVSIEGMTVNTAAGITITISAVMMILTVALFFLKIKVTITRSLLTVGIFKGRTVTMEDIEKVSAEEFSALKDFFGWGIKIGRKGLGYITAGTDKGIRIHLKNGRSFLISTHDPFAFESAVRTALRNVKSETERIR
jgi:hypothetical protein